MAKDPRSDFERFGNLSYEDFQKLAQDKSLSIYEKIGFPDSYRQDSERLIFADVLAKCTPLNATEKTIVDIGCGCSEIPRLLIDHCRRQRHVLTLIDSKEMLAQLPDGEFTKVAGKFPSAETRLPSFKGQFDVVLIYSVFHYAFLDSNLYGFLDAAAALLAPGGMLLIGDIPNVSKRKRFFSSEAGVRFHQKFMNTSERPQVLVHEIETDKIDDGVVFGILQRYRNFGFESYLLPMNSSLPLSNRREDILIVRN